jgi:tRNA threonylcarbamoyladenosine biosynthesis protein TsaB
MLDARRLEVYSSRVSSNQVGEAEAIVLDQAFFDDLPKLPIIILGDGASKCRQFQAGHAHIADIPPDASMMIDLVQTKFVQQQFEDVAYFEPCYLKEYIVGVSTKSIF